MQTANVLLIGSGGREHALAWSISKSPACEKLFIAPGNPGTALLGENVEVDVDDPEAVTAFCSLMRINLVVVGPEQYLVDGLADELAKNNVPVFGPSGYAAQLEGSKSFAKNIMQKYGVPTAGYQSFELSDIDAITSYIKNADSFPIVLKADGLAAGKGVYIPESRDEALKNLKEIQSNATIKEAAQTLVIEEFLDGEEASVFAICDGEDFVVLTAAQDHKRIGEGDTGPNTGGMGAYTPAPVVDDEMMERVKREIITPTLNGMKSEGHPYVGVLYVGLMINKQGPKVVEFNCRFGDPECQIILPKLKTDLLPVLMKAAHGNLRGTTLEFHPGYVTCVVMASGGYPGSYQKGEVICGLSKATSSHLVFHAGTESKGLGTVVTNGGRVLSVIGRGDTLQSSIDDAYAGIKKISFKDGYFRRDIGEKGLAYFR